MKIVFIGTNSAQSKCGVADYTKKLIEALISNGAAASFDFCEHWSFKELLNYHHKYKRQKETILHLQYPTLGMGNSLSPAFLPLFFQGRLFLTLHEFSIFNILRKMLFLPHALFSNMITFTNDFERRQFLNLFPFAKNKTVIVPIGNNIEVKKADGFSMRPKALIYFGQISEDKGIDFFVDTIKALRQDGYDFQTAIMGSVINKSSPLMDMINRASRDLHIELLFNLESDDVSARLQKSSVALLPFPDGITEKRGSALACMKHDVSVVTIHTQKTPQWMKDTTYHAGQAREASKIIAELLNQKDHQNKSKDVLKRELAARKWPEIAKEHIVLYQSKRTRGHA